MVKEFTNLNDLEKYIKAIITDTMQFVSTELKNVLREYIQEKFYDTYNPVEYDRSYDLLDSPIEVYPIVNGNKITAGVRLDPDRLKQSVAVSKSGKFTNLRHGWHDPNDIFLYTAGLKNGYVERMPSEVTYDVDYDRAIVGDRGAESYWLSFLKDYIDSGEWKDILVKRLRQSGFDVIVL